MMAFVEVCVGILLLCCAVFVLVFAYRAWLEIPNKEEGK
jgi:Ca2+/Na+ antiporter